MNKFILYFSLISVFACSQQTTIGMKDHKYSMVPNHIVWIQVPGFLYEHTVLRNFESPSPVNYSIWNEFSCVGYSWSYNLYNIRPSNRDQALTQVTGNQNIKNNCLDYEQKTLWDFLKIYKYKSLVIEKQPKSKNSFLSSLNCKKSNFLDNVSFLLMDKKNKQINQKKFFHYQSSNYEFKPGEILIDKTCQNGDCISSIKDNLEKTWEKLLQKNSKSFLLVRDFDYEKIVSSKNALNIKKRLFEYEKLLRYILEKRKVHPDMLVVFSSTNGKRIEFPKQGKRWNELFDSGKYLTFHNKSLYNNFLSMGARSENFCGSFNDSEIIDRFLWLNKDYNYLKSIKNYFHKLKK